MSGAFHVSLEMRGKEDGEAVHYKNDGERFPEGQANTVKMNVSCSYTLTLFFRPARVLTHWMIRGEKVEFERVNPSKAEEDVSIYETTWTSTGLEVTKRGDRYSLPIDLELYPGLVMKMVLQTKFYPALETTHRKWGPEVHSIEYKCEVPESQMSVNIVHEKII